MADASNLSAGSSADVEQKLADFKALASKEKMKEHLKKINEDIILRKNRISISGPISTLNDNYRAYLERVASTADYIQSAKQRTKAKSKSGSVSGESGDDEDIVQGEISNVLFRMVMSDFALISTKTKECLNFLKAPLFKSCDTKRKRDDLSVHLEPLLAIVVAYIRARNTVNSNLTPNHTENMESLFHEIAQNFSTIYAPAVYKPLCDAVGIELIEQPADTGNTEADQELSRSALPADAELAQSIALAEEIDIVWDAMRLNMQRWQETFPVADDGQLVWPIDFSSSEKRTLRAHVKEYLSANPQLTAEVVSREVYLAAVNTLLNNWPITKGKCQNICQLVFSDQKNDIKLSRARSRSSSSRSRSTSSAGATTPGTDTSELSLIRASIGKQAGEENGDTLNLERDAAQWDDSDSDDPAVIAGRRRRYEARRNRAAQAIDHELVMDEEDEDIFRLQQQRDARRRSTAHAPALQGGIAGAKGPSPSGTKRCRPIVESDDENEERPRIPRLAANAQGGRQRFPSPSKTASQRVSLRSIEEEDGEE